MANRTVGLIFLACATSFWTSACSAQTASSRPKAAHSPITLPIALSWLPADTETLIVANGPFAMSRSEVPVDETRSRLISKKALREQFESLPSGLVGLEKGLFEKYLNGEQVEIAMEGSRHFRSPSGLGGMPYEGCDIVVFAGDIASLGDAFMKDSKNVAVKFEEVEGQRVAVFQGKLEEDVWTTLVVFPRANVLIIATNRDYLREVLARMGGATGPRALPNELPEWKYVDTHAHCWGLRHYDKSQANLDPSSPFGGEKSANFADEEAIGLVFNFAPTADGEATITYLSGAKDAISMVREHLFPPLSDPDSVKDMQIQFRELAPGVVQSSCRLVHSEPAMFFFFVLLGVLGHAIYL